MNEIEKLFQKFALIQEVATVNKITYAKPSGNNHIKKLVLAGGKMPDKKYDTVKIKRSGMQISFEFPPKSARDQIIEQEVKAIISEELRERSREIPAG